jgi:hypothetical protein
MCKIENQDIWCKIASCQNTVAAEQPIYTNCKKVERQHLVWGACGKTDQWRKPAKRSRTIECPDCVARRKEQEERRLQALAREAVERSELENEGRAHWGQLGYSPYPYQWPQPAEYAEECDVSDEYLDLFVDPSASSRHGAGGSYYQDPGEGPSSSG